MASVSGGNFDGTSSKVQANAVGASKDASSSAIGQHLGVAAASQHSLVAVAAAPSSIESAVSGARDTVTFAGTSAGTAGKIEATQTTHQSGVTLSFQDGSSLTVLGAHDLGHFFGH